MTRATRRSWAQRPRYRIILSLAAVALAAVALAGCAGVRTATTQRALSQAGFAHASVSLMSGTGTPAGGLVAVTYRSAPVGPSTALDAQSAARIVWETLPYRFGAVSVSILTGGCFGPACGTSEHVVGSASYADLRGLFGARPADLDRRSAAGAVGSDLKLFGGVIAALVLVAVILVVMVVRHQRRRSTAWTGFQQPTPEELLKLEWGPPTQPPPTEPGDRPEPPEDPPAGAGGPPASGPGGPTR